MVENFLVHVSQICAQISSFGEVLDTIRQRRNLTQKQLAERIFRSEAEVSRLLNNQLPKRLGVSDIHQLAKCLDCTRTEMVELVETFVCHILYDYELIDLDVY